MSSPILLAVLAGTAAATWTICVKFGSTNITAALGAMTITGAAFVVNGLALVIMRATGHEITFKPEAFWLLAIAGVAAAGVDTFALLAYERGLKVTSSLIISGTSTVLVLLVGFVVLHEPVTWARLLGIALIVAGMLILQAQGG
ncbi:MAG: EamA family transporter [Candidatus Rokuibacteriota bacterium]